MTSTSEWATKTVPVGRTPIPYDSWDEHRAAIRRDAASYRQAAAERRARRAGAEA